jgi:hypothetical protein
MMRDLSDQLKGGTLEIPDNYFVSKADFDTDEPHICITSEEDMDNTIKILVPKSLAYYLSTHYCGSKKMHDLIEEHTKTNIRNTIKDALGFE